MKINHFKYIIMTLCLAFFTACENFTDLEPTDMAGSDVVFKDANSVKDLITGTYALMSLKTSMGISEYIADDVVQGSDAGGAGTDLYTWVYTNNCESSGVWSRCYSIINNANRALHLSKNIKPTTQEDINTLSAAYGQAYFLRAYAHFELLRFFSDFQNEEALGIPYISYPHVTGMPERDKVSYCYDYIMQDLERAYDLIQESQTDLSFATQNAVQAMRARVSLYRGKYIQAYVYATEVLRHVPLASINEYPAIWKDKNLTEIIFQLPRAKGQDYIGTLFVGGDNSSVFRPSVSYMNCYPAGDVRTTCFFDKGPDRGGDIVDRVSKYIGTPDNIGLNNEKVIRSSEMKLIQIESLIHQDKLIDANNELNSFRAIRISNWNNMQFDKNALLDEILLERRREFAFENQRFFDLRRFNRDIVRDNASTLAADHFRMIMPIPQSEDETNENIIQNPGYKDL